MRLRAIGRRKQDVVDPFLPTKVGAKAREAGPMSSSSAHGLDMRDGQVVRMRFYWIMPRPSKPPGCGSRRCRRRTWRSCARLLEPFAGPTSLWSTAAKRSARGVRRAYSPEIELRTLASGLGSGVGESYRGFDGLVRYLREWLEPFAEYRVERLDYIEAGDWVLVPTRQRGVGKASGARAELELVHAYKLRNGQIVRLNQYDTVEEALEAAGLSE